MVSEESGGRDSDPVSSQLSSVACACLLSLVVGLGDTSKMLSAISMMLIGSSQLSTTIQVCIVCLCVRVWCVCVCVTPTLHLISKGVIILNTSRFLRYSFRFKNQFRRFYSREYGK